MARPTRADVLRTVVCHLACSRLTGLPLSSVWDKRRRRAARPLRRSRPPSKAADPGGRRDRRRRPGRHIATFEPADAEGTESDRFGILPRAFCFAKTKFGDAGAGSRTWLMAGVSQRRPPMELEGVT